MERVHSLLKTYLYSHSGVLSGDMPWPNEVGFLKVNHAPFPLTV